MKNIFFVLAYIAVMCAFYLYQGRDTGAGMDDRVAIVVALGRFPPLAEQFSKPDPIEEYISLIDYKKYPDKPVSLQKVYQSIINDNSNGCIYYFTLSFLIKAVGYNLWWLRSLSVFIAGVNLFMFYRVAEKFQMRPLFVWTTLIMASVNPIFIINTLLIRSYMFALLGCLLSIYFLIRINTEERRSNYTYYFLSVLLAVGSHYFTLSVLAAEFIFIALKWGMKPPERKLFLTGYFCLTILAAGWFFLAYPVSWNNLQYLIADNLAIANLNAGYQFTIPNLLKQWLNIFTYFFGFTTDAMGKVRVLIKLVTAFLFLMMIYKLWIMRSMRMPRLLLTLLIMSMIFYSLQSLYEGQLINFIPKYLLFIMPLAVFGINMVLSDLYTRKFGPHTRPI